MNMGVSAFVLVLFSLLAPRLNFSGTWVMDPARSFGNPAGLEQTMTIAQDGDKITLEAKLKTSQGERTVNEQYIVNGQEAAFTPQPAPDGKTVTGKRTASWLPENRGMVVIEVVGEQTTTRKWSLSADGSVLTVDYFFDTPRGSFEAKRVFAKK
jgi:hypothetical protein